MRHQTRLDRKWIVGTTALALALGGAGGPLVRPAFSADAAGAAAGATAPTGRRNRGGKRAGGKRGAQATRAAADIKRLEAVLGKPLTDDQKTALTSAQQKYQEARAAAVGMTVDELAAKEKEYRAAQRAKKAGG